jgi:5-methylcytosine-specific restriction endonuclease McrA
MGRALVLNASYEPLCVVPARRAVVLVLSDKADTVHESGTEFHSEHMSIAVPSVVRLRYYVRVPYERATALSRRAVFHRDQGTCQYCGGSADSIDHVVPRSRGGLHVWDNVVAACRRCNTAKGDRMLHEIAMTLTTRPTMPRELSWVMVAVADVPELWRQYLHPARLASA